MFEGRAAAALSPARELALDCLAAGIEAARPATAVRRHCSLDGNTLRIHDTSYELSAFDEVRVLGGGNGADEIAAGLEDLLVDDRRSVSGVVVTDTQTTDLEEVTVRTGEHPTPGDESLAGAEAVIERATTADETTLVVAPVTGGGSALLCAPAGDLTAADLATVADALAAAGAPVDEINTVRRACSTIKGGGLAAAAAPATVVGLVVGDVVGDDPGVVASGPTVPTAVEPDAALAVLDRYVVDAPAVRAFLDGAARRPAPDVGVDTHVIAAASDAVEAARRVAADRGFEPCVLATRLEGEAREAGRFHAAVAAEIAGDGRPVDPPAVLVSAGETTVTVDESGGDGGPNLEFVVGCGLDLPTPAVVAAVDTDGHDGGTDAAGAILERIDDPPAARTALARHDSLTYLESRNALLRTGSTGTNVNDLRIVVLKAKPF